MALDWLSSLASLFNSSSSGAGGAGGGGFNGIVDDYSGSAAPSKGFDWAGGFKSFGKEVAPGLAQAGTAALFNKLLPGQNSQIVSMDPRTGTGQGAEALRLQTAQTAGSQLQSSFTNPYGALTPEEQKRIKSQTRNADAARGMLNTGGSAARERRALDEANTKRQNELYGHINTGTSGYTSKQAGIIPGQANPWATILTQALAPGVGKGFGQLLDKWWV